MGPQNVPTDDEPAPVEQELVFSVGNMTCGGGGPFVRNLAESQLSGQKTPSSSFTTNKVQVDWRAGIMSIYGTQPTDYISGGDCGILGEAGVAVEMEEV